MCQSLKIGHDEDGKLNGYSREIYVKLSKFKINHMNG